MFTKCLEREGFAVRWVEGSFCRVGSQVGGIAGGFGKIEGGVASNTGGTTLSSLIA